MGCFKSSSDVFALVFIFFNFGREVIANVTKVWDCVFNDEWNVS